jgi:hypothetical protein
MATCAHAASVCRALEPSRRREVLSFGHHAEVAALDGFQNSQLIESLAVCGARAAAGEHSKLPVGGKF